MNKAQEDAAYYAVITAPVRYDPELSSTAKLLYCEITSLCRAKGYCWATNKHFAELYGVSESTISRLVSQLERRGHIRVKTATVKKGSERRIYTDVYYVERIESAGPEGGTQKEQPPQGGCAKTAKGGTQKDQGGGRKNRKQNDCQLSDLSERDPPCSPPEGDGAPGEQDGERRHSGADELSPQGEASERSPCRRGDKPAPKRTRRDKSAPAHNPEAFDVLWAAYPRKDSRQAAIRAWDKLKPDRALCRVMYDALKRQCRSEQWAEDGGRYIPMFSTWINQRRWENQGVDLSLLRASPPRSTPGGWAPDPEVPS